MTGHIIFFVSRRTLFNAGLQSPEARFLFRKEDYFQKGQGDFRLVKTCIPLWQPDIGVQNASLVHISTQVYNSKWFSLLYLWEIPRRPSDILASVLSLLKNKSNFLSSSTLVDESNVLLQRASLTLYVRSPLWLVRGFLLTFSTELSFRYSGMSAIRQYKMTLEKRCLKELRH